MHVFLVSIGNHAMESTSHDYLFIISMTKLDTSQCQHHNYSLAKAQYCQTFNQNILCFCSYFHLVLLLKQNLVLFFVCSSSSSRAISYFHVCV